MAKLAIRVLSGDLALISKKTPIATNGCFHIRGRKMLQLIQLLASVVCSLVGYAEDKQLLDAGAAKAIMEGMKDVNEKIANARAVRADTRGVSVDTDKRNRDNW